jgi:hypothetical protein
VPDCYGWLALDARGQWRLRGELVVHPGLIAFLNAHYTRDEHGRWLVQNGPQRVFVELDAAPLILRLHPDGSVLTHAGKPVTPAAPLLMDADGNAFMASCGGAGMIDDRDLAGFAAALTKPDGSAAGDSEVLELIAGAAHAGLRWRDLVVEFCPRADIPLRLGYRSVPEPER